MLLLHMACSSAAHAVLGLTMHAPADHTLAKPVVTPHHSGHTSHQWSHLTPVVTPHHSGHTSPQWSHLTPVVTPHSSGHTSLQWSHLTHASANMLPSAGSPHCIVLRGVLPLLPMTDLLEDDSCQELYLQLVAATEEWWDRQQRLQAAVLAGHTPGPWWHVNQEDEEEMQEAARGGEGALWERPRPPSNCLFGDLRLAAVHTLWHATQARLARLGRATSASCTMGHLTAAAAWLEGVSAGLCRLLLYRRPLCACCVCA
jgi:hypothetical protein